MFINDKKFKIDKIDDFNILIPRFISSLMMHMVVMPDGRQGLRLMKFAFKHPNCFRTINQDKMAIEGAESEKNESMDLD